MYSSKLIEFGVTQKTAWFMLQRIRHALKSEGYKDPLDSDVEVDQSFFGGKERNKHMNKKSRFNTQGGKGKIPVFGMLQRDREIRTKVICDTTASALKPLIRENVAIGATIYSDENSCYNRLDQEGFDHRTVSHTSGEYVRDDVHINTLERFWSQLKRGINGIYHQVNSKHLQKYCDEYEYRYNIR